MAEIPADDFSAAKVRGDDRLAAPRAISAHYDAGRNRVVIRLTTGVEVAFPPAFAQGLENAKPADLADIEITPAGLGVHFPRLDADLYVPALLQGILGSPSWMAGLMGRIGGTARTAAKVLAARENGKRGGRPKKTRVA